MKRIVFLLFALLCSMNFYAQMWDSSKPDKNLTFGVRAGVNMSTFGGSKYYDYESRWSFHAGMNADLNIVKSFAIETGLFYTSKGAKMRYINKNEGSVSYVQLPLLALFRFPISEETHVQVKAGGYAGYLIEEPETLKVKKPDMGIIVGTGINYRKFFLGLQYELGLYKTIFREDKNRNLAISVGYDF